MALWILGLFTFALGVGIGFLSLETAGFVWLLMALAGLVLWQRRSPALAMSLIACGLGSVAAVAFFAVRTSGLFSGSEDPGTIAYFASQLAIGLTVTVGGIVLHYRKEWAHPR
jgi:hypothetical protein